MKKFLMFAIICTITWFAVSNPLTEQYVDTLKHNSVPTAIQKDSLLKEIEAKATKAAIQPSDARIDPVWKAIPAYNGLTVDIQASYKNMKELGQFNPEKLLYKQVKPNVHLKDLPSAPIYRGHPDKPMVSFIINVAWGNEYLPEILATLKIHKISASFFLEGNWVKQNPDLAKMIVDAGHEVGNHSYTHPDMKQLSAAKIREQLTKTNEVIEATTGVKATWFAPPSGSYRDEVVKIAAEFKLGTVMWSVDTIDWQKPSQVTLINRVIGKVHNGALILMHPTDSTTRSLDSLIKQIQIKGLSIGTVTQLMDEERMMKNNLHFGESKSKKSN
jgi:probable sporulation protein (polysaccharide deacetylase family)